MSKKIKTLARVYSAIPSITVRGSGGEYLCVVYAFMFYLFTFNFFFVFDPLPHPYGRVSFPPGRVKTNGERLVDIIIYTTLYHFEYYKLL